MWRKVWLIFSNLSTFCYSYKISWFWISTCCFNCSTTNKVGSGSSGGGVSDSGSEVLLEVSTGSWIGVGGEVQSWQHPLYWSNSSRCLVCKHSLQRSTGVLNCR